MRRPRPGECACLLSESTQWVAFILVPSLTRKHKPNTHTPLCTHTHTHSGIFLQATPQTPTNWKTLNRYIYIYLFIHWQVILTSLINSESINSLQFKICFYLDNEKSDTTTHVTSCRDTWGMKISPQTELTVLKKKKKCIKENNQQFIQVFVLRSSKDIGVTLKE